MRRSEDESVPVWSEFKQRFSFPKLEEDLEADVCVVGAGIAGLTTAYFLQKEGKKVVVLEAWDLCAGETGRTTAHLTAVLDDRFSKLEKIFGEKKTRIATESHLSAINRIENIIKEEGIKCDFERVPGYLVASGADQMQLFEDETEASLRAGFADRERVEKIPFGKITLGPALHFPEQATFNISEYMQGLARAFLGMGGRIYTSTRVVEFNDGDGSGRAFVATEDGDHVFAPAIVVATNTPVNDRVTMHTKQAAYRTYVVAFKIAKDSYPGFLLWDLKDPYHYVRVLRDEKHDWLVVGGEDHKTGQANDADKRYHRLQEWTYKHFPAAGKVIYRWSGQVMEPVDSLAFIGRNPGDDHIFIATGDSGHGMTHGTIAGMLLTDLILGRQNPWAEIYDPSRKPTTSAGEYLLENANAAGRMVTDRLKPAEISSVDNLKPGEGGILRRGLSQLAVYRDPEGEIREKSAVCTHLGCIVQWNGGEKSWDCPCHGSRFRTDGEILNGPALSPLSSAEGDEDVKQKPEAPREKEQEQRV